MKGMHFKSEIAQRELSDLGNKEHASGIPSAHGSFNFAAGVIALKVIRSAERVGRHSPNGGAAGPGFPG